jgi:pyruvate/2-oxoglutarate dehydrogenase complex dihydrolipoamide dehydrogenase (E3) component
MKAAMTAAQRGHEVTLYEQSERLGGCLNHSDFVSFKWPLREFRDYLIHQVGKLGIQVRLNTRCTPEDLAAGRYDDVIVAIGAAPIVPPIPGADGPHVYSAISVFGKEDTLTQTVAIIGGGEVGVELGIHLARMGHKVTLLEGRDRLAPDAAPIHFRSILERTWQAEPNLTVLTRAMCTEIREDGVAYTCDGQPRLARADSVILAVGSRSRTEEALGFFGAGGRTHLVGDCEQVGSVQTTMRSAHFTALQV